MTEQRLKDRIAVVTGASRGIGWHTSLALAKEGAHIIAVAKTVGALEELDDEIQALGGSTTLVPLDLMDYDAIDRLGGAIYERWGKLDILFGNAGLLGAVTPITHLDPVKDWEKVMGVNLTANWRLIRSLDPLLRQSDAGRALFVTSGSPHKCNPYWGIYSISKAGLEAMVRTYAGEIQQTNVKANCFNPGPTRTGMRAKAVPGEDPMTLPHPTELVPHIVNCLVPDCMEQGRMYDFRSASWKIYGSPVYDD
ncbi:NAD(P)-dependent dehydrogenase, short-chain alcohol dehydrogenase family [Cohaesibacter marisflavi]|uniref:NAD(P)-dependent dehydrogenase, short-chain alcohol dehydrogenase family n=1 Tax=Cohaesibacter marisflavi TaxID=655353 RepID=A0A1I5FY23_9HYPH|nr:SDR family NAD(P)-dependent oxidoreductase [Cohaesibacter marisflavi]SFO28503.1 NAD(P)-dependent dehydrogenase, short-chain alcohol dehydrogenase family [Cohaesibacter marisflavi]